ncbi:hypothetical protein CBL_14025 [Carabus blaptoides fortunei]
MKRVKGMEITKRKKAKESLNTTGSRRQQSNSVWTEPSNQHSEANKPERDEQRLLIKRESAVATETTAAVKSTQTRRITDDARNRTPHSTGNDRALEGGLSCEVWGPQFAPPDTADEHKKCCLGQGDLKQLHVLLLLRLALGGGIDPHRALKTCTTESTDASSQKHINNMRTCYTFIIPNSDRSSGVWTWVSRSWIC